MYVAYAFVYLKHDNLVFLDIFFASQLLRKAGPCEFAVAISPRAVWSFIMYGQAYRKIMDQPGKVADRARGQLNRENEYSPVPVRA